MMTIALLTDFGHQDPFVGVMKAVIFSRAPKARVLDVCHGVPAGDVRAGALALEMSVPYFPKGTLFVTVVDPGVGSKRRILWARTKNHAFLAPSKLGPVRSHYAAVPAGKPLAVAGSSGLIELSVRDGDFRTRFRAAPGDPVHVR